MITLLLAIFFFIYQGVGIKITNRKIIECKRSFDLSVFQKIRDFAYSTNKDLFERYHNSALKLLRISMLCFALFSFLGGKPTLSSILFGCSFLLMIAFMTPKQFKKEFKQGFINWGQRLVFAALGLGVIWIFDKKLFDQFAQLGIQIFKTATTHSGIPAPVFIAATIIFLLFMILFNFVAWATLHLFAWAVIHSLKIFTKFCFELNNRRPQEPAYLIFQITTLIISFSVEK